MTGLSEGLRALSEALARCAPSLVPELLPTGRREGRDWRVGSLAGEPGTSLAVCLSGPRAGRWTDFATGERGDALDLVGAVLFRGRARDAATWARNWLGLTPEAGPVIERRPVPIEVSPDAAERSERALRDWRACGPVPGTPGEANLAGRGLAQLATCPVLRWCPSASHPHGGRFPAMVALVQAPDGTPLGIHRTYLTPDGRKAAVKPGKASCGPVGGGAVRLEPVAAELVIGEGIESAASAGLLLGLPAWAALSTSGLMALRLPCEVRRVVIAADHDANGAGQLAADKAARRWRAEGRTVRIALPDLPGQDFNDVLRDTLAMEAARG